MKKEETGTIHVIKQRQLHLSCDIISLNVSTQNVTGPVPPPCIIQSHSLTCISMKAQDCLTEWGCTIRQHWAWLFIFNFPKSAGLLHLSAQGCVEWWCYPTLEKKQTNKPYHRRSQQAGIFILLIILLLFNFINHSTMCVYVFFFCHYCRMWTSNVLICPAELFNYMQNNISTVMERQHDISVTDRLRLM